MPTPVSPIDLVLQLVASSDALDAPARRLLAVLIEGRRGEDGATDTALLAEELLGAFGSAVAPPLSGRIAAFPRLAKLVDALPADRRQPLLGPARRPQPLPLPGGTKQP